MGAGPHPRRRPRPARPPRVADRRRRARPLAPGRSLYCAAGQPLGLRGARRSSELGYERRSRSPAATSTGSATACRPTCRARSAPSAATRYSRHLLIPEVGEEGQLRLLDSRILLIGAGGLGSPASLYLAAAGVGTLGIVDADVVDETNLQRQIAHSTDSLGEPKIDSARRTIEALEPRRRGRAVPRAADLRERRADPRARLGRDRRRRRQLPDPLPRQRRVGLARHPGRARLDLPLRGPGDGLQAAARAPATAASSRSRRRPSWRRAAPRAACSACCRA